MNLEEENQQLKLENQRLKEQLKKYTNPQSFKTYYEKIKIKFQNNKGLINNIRHDNRISNLRIVSPSINAHNKVKKQNCSSKYIGVSFNKKSKKWISYINFNSKQIRIGEFNIELDAAKAYNKKAIELYKENANLNKIE